MNKELREEALKNLYKELESLLKKRRSMKPGSDEYDDIDDAAKTVAKQIVDFEGLQNAITIEELKQDGEIAKNENNIEIEKIKQAVPKTRVILELTKVFAPPIMYFLAQVWGTNKSQKFEASGYQEIMNSSREIKNFLYRLIKM